MRIFDAISEFLNQAQARGRLSANTCRAYQNDLLGFASFLSETKGLSDMAGLSGGLKPSDIRSYLSSLYETHERTSISRRLSAIRSFLRFARMQGWIDKDVGGLVPTPKSRRPLPKFLKIEE